MNQNGHLVRIFSGMAIGLVVTAAIVGASRPYADLFSTPLLRQTAVLMVKAAKGWLESVPAVRRAQLHQVAEAAWQSADWSSCIELYSELHGLEPENAAIPERLGTAHRLYAQQLIEQGDLRAALIQLHAARIILPQSDSLDSLYRLLSEYQQGEENYQRSRWTAAANHFERVYAVAPDFKDIKQRLFAATLQEGLWQQSMGRALQARWRYERSLRLYPENILARQKLAEVTDLLTKPDRRIVVSISQQRMYLYENGRSIHTWPCSTGEFGRATKPGHYKVQSRLKMAYARAWDLDMPYWLGIYYAGSTENGIHAPPITRSTGQKMWEGLIGYPVSYGCIILSEENARTLYEWAPYQTPVDVIQ